MRIPSLVSSASFAVLCASAVAQSGTWVQLAFGLTPAAREDAQLVYDSARDRLVMVGGRNGNGSFLPETWENDGASWIFRGAFGTTAYNAVRAVYDSQRQRVVAVRCEPGLLSQTWEWDGQSWQVYTPSPSPAGRCCFGLAYDSARGRTVLFGGNGPGGDLADTWEWDGSSWFPVATGGPPLRESLAMAFDSHRGVTVLFGGHRDSGGAQNYDDTWEWNGLYWLQRGLGNPAPSGRSQHRMTYDRARQRIVLYGGFQVYGGGASYTDTWEWDGSSWTNMFASTPASRRTGLAFDSLRERIVQFGGAAPGNAVTNGTWAYSVLSQPATAVPYGSGCTGPNGIPLLGSGDTPRLGTTYATFLTNLPSGITNIALGWIGFDNTNWNGVPLPLPLDPAGFPGCFALLAPSQALVLNNNNGSATWSLAIPFVPALSGHEFFLQGGVLVLGYNPGGVVFSNGVHAVLGG